MPNLATNKHGLYEYEALEKFEAGIKLLGPEVKSVKKGQIQLKGSFVLFERGGRPILHGTHIAAYKPAASRSIRLDVQRPRPLLLRQSEIHHMMGKMTSGHLTIIPTRVYTKGGIIKIEIALVRKKKQYNKRAILRQRDLDRETRSSFKYAG